MVQRQADHKLGASDRVAVDWPSSQDAGKPAPVRCDRLPSAGARNSATDSLIPERYHEGESDHAPGRRPIRTDNGELLKPRPDVLGRALTCAPQLSPGDCRHSHRHRADPCLRRNRREAFTSNAGRVAWNAATALQAWCCRPILPSRSSLRPLQSSLACLSNPMIASSRRAGEYANQLRLSDSNAGLPARTSLWLQRSPEARSEMIEAEAAWPSASSRIGELKREEHSRIRERRVLARKHDCQVGDPVRMRLFAATA